jgi:hypothetical protein
MKLAAVMTPMAMRSLRLQLAIARMALHFH